MEIINIFLSAFIIGFVASTIAVGPAMFLAFRNALLGKYKRSVSLLLGASVMEAIYCSFALTIVGAIFFHSRKIQIFSKTLTIIIFLTIGIFLLRTDPRRELTLDIEKLSRKERVKSFLTGFILVALNPTIILTWSAAVTALIYFDIISIHRFFDALFFTLSATAGNISGGLTMIFLVKFFKMKFSFRFVKIVLRLIGILLIGLSIYFLLRLFGIPI